MVKSNYNQYLKSVEWKDIKTNYYKNNAKQCLRCKSLTEIHLHHLSYSILEDKKFQDNYLVPLCKQCHSAVHSKKLNPSAIGDPTRSKIVLSKAEFAICAIPNFRPAKLKNYFSENKTLKGKQKGLKKKIRKMKSKRILIGSTNESKRKARNSLLGLVSKAGKKDRNLLAIEMSRLY
jgi:hypothetical protein